MKLHTIIEMSGIESVRVIGGADVEIADVVFDSREVTPGALFFCIVGEKNDGHEYGEQAVSRGASALMVSRELDLDIPQVVVSNDRAAMALLSAAFFQNPSRRMRIIGITGTNGKTSTSYMLKSILESAGHKVGLIGTITNMIGRERVPTERTTPESPDLQRLLARMLKEGCDTVVMEVSSHSLWLKRVDGIHYDVAVYTNLSVDHLDFHGTLENYAAAKHVLFTRCESVAFNRDDEHYLDVIGSIDMPTVDFGIQNHADIMAHDIEITPRGVHFMMQLAGQSIPINLRIPGLFSVYNAMAAAGAARLLNVTTRSILEGLEAIVNVSGRFEVLDAHSKDMTVILDYAHSPDGLENVLSSIKTFARGRIVTVFGCGGDRDTGKRPMMGEIAGKYSDFCIITSDNPRSEQPLSIIASIETGIKNTDCDYIVIENRRDAIFYALEHFEAGDCVLLAGKGHEDYQEIRGIKYKFDERVIVEEILTELDARG